MLHVYREGKYFPGITNIYWVDGIYNNSFLIFEKSGLFLNNYKEKTI